MWDFILFLKFALRLRESRARVVAPEWLRHEEVKIASEEGIRTGAATLQKSGRCFGLSDTRNYRSVRAKSQLRSASQSMLSPTGTGLPRQRVLESDLTNSESVSAQAQTTQGTANGSGSDPVDAVDYESIGALPIQEAAAPPSPARRPGDPRGARVISPEWKRASPGASGSPCPRQLLIARRSEDGRPTALA